MSNIDRDKMIERVRSLLAMGSDVSSPNEAAIALKRARKLMDKYQIGLFDIENAKDDDFTSSDFDTGNSQRKRWFEYIASKVAVMNDCKITVAKEFDPNEFKYIIKYRFSGFKEDVALSEFMLSYIYDTCMRLYKEDKEPLEIKGVSGKNSYLLGLSHGICFKINGIIESRKEHISESTGTELVLLKSKIVEDKFGENRFNSAKNYKVNKDQEAMRAGIEASAKVNLGSFLDASESKKQIK